MPQFKAPLRDIRFLVHDVYRFAEHYAAHGHEEIGADLIDPVLDEAARFCENVLDPTRVEGDEIGTKLADGKVEISPDGEFDEIRVLLPADEKQMFIRLKAADHPYTPPPSQS